MSRVERYFINPNNKKYVSTHLLNDVTYKCKENGTDHIKFVIKIDIAYDTMMKEVILNQILTTGQYTLTHNQKDATYTTYIIPNNIVNEQIVPKFVESFLQKNQYNSTDEVVFVAELFGHDLLDFTDEVIEKNLSETEIKSIIKQIVIKLKLLHSIGISHGDMCAENVCAKYENDHCSVRLIDFGFAVIHPKSPIYNLFKDKEHNIYVDIVTTDDDPINVMRCIVDTNNMLFGRIGTISPERHKATFSNSSYDAYKDDIYSIGTIMFVLFANILFIDEYIDINEHFYKIKNRTWIDVLKHHHPDTSTDAIDLMKKLITFEKDRITLDEILMHPWLIN